MRCMVLYSEGTAQITALYRTAPYCDPLQYTVLSYPVLYRIALYSILYTGLSCTVMYYTALDCTVK